MSKFTFNKQALDNHWATVRNDYESGRIQFNEFAKEARRLTAFCTLHSIDLGASA